MKLPPDFDPSERWLALAIDAMDKNRRLAVLDNDLIKIAEIDAWFKSHAPAIRPIRDRMEAAEFDGP
ncbi:hypothetical protein GURKE_02290 [Brevundimonas phage vB_BpoS-Gurke]|uniref:Uncharacterized protein n=1 Tax=Brevundimonas phage vB_BpoS-Gurke TaxID=2948599 RepID=A0A9E7N398_9CAUD|nr:hypothetical protein GURKE_02290 [Brevundimonas phage vB_BpoS-Gurke]